MAARRYKHALMAAARSSGHRVEVTALRAETRHVYANPNGTFTADFGITADYPAGLIGWAMVLSGRPGSSHAGNSDWGGALKMYSTLSSSVLGR